jgi:hypothetical protein
VLDAESSDFRKQNEIMSYHNEGLLTKAFVAWDGLQIVTWIFLAAFVAFYGNGQSDLVSLFLYDERLNRYS